MYKVFIPVMNHKMSRQSKQKLVSEIKRAEATAVFLTFSRVLRKEEMLRQEIALFCENKEFLEQNGIKVAAWLAPTIGYGGTSALCHGQRRAGQVYAYSLYRRRGGICLLPDRQGFSGGFYSYIESTLRNRCQRNSF